MFQKTNKSCMKVQVTNIMLQIRCLVCKRRPLNSQTHFNTSNSCKKQCPTSTPEMASCLTEMDEAKLQVMEKYIILKYNKITSRLKSYIYRKNNIIWVIITTLRAIWDFKVKSYRNDKGTNKLIWTNSLGESNRD